MSSLGTEVSTLKREVTTLKTEPRALSATVAEQQSKLQTLSPNFNKLYSNPVHAAFASTLPKVFRINLEA